MAGQKYFSPKRRHWRLLSATAFMAFWLFIVGRDLVTGWVQKGTIAPIPVAMALIGIFIIVNLWRKRPPLTCQGCNAMGWVKDLDRNNPVCPLCGHSHFLTSGRFRDGTSAFIGVVLGAEIVSGVFRVDSRGGGDCGDWGVTVAAGTAAGETDACLRFKPLNKPPFNRLWLLILFFRLECYSPLGAIQGPRILKACRDFPDQIFQLMSYGGNFW